MRIKGKFKTGIRLERRVFSYPYVLFMLVFILLPLCMMLVNAFIADGKLSLANFAEFFTQSQNVSVLLNSVVVGIVVTVICLLIGYPAAYILSKYFSKTVLVILFTLPMWVNFLIRTLAMKSIFLAMNVELGVGTLIIGLVYNFLPFMILPLNTTISGIDKNYIEAAQDLGADGMTVFLKTILPLSVPGIISGVTMVFIPTISTFAISEFLAGGAMYLFGDSINTKVMHNMYGVASVMSLIMMVFVILSNVIMNRKGSTETEAKNLW